MLRWQSFDNVVAAVIDDRFASFSPEGARLTLTPAGPLPRACAFAIDLAIRVLIYLLLVLAMTLSGLYSSGLLLISIFLLEWFYPVLFELLRHGQTPGKSMMHLVVTHGDGTPISVNGSLIRNLLRQADFFPLFYLSGLISMLLTRRFQRLGDLAANTLVIHNQMPNTPPASDIAAGDAADWPLSLQDQQVLVGFLERHTSLSAARRQELAQLAWPELDGADAEQRALGCAARLLGGAESAP